MTTLEAKEHTNFRKDPFGKPKGFFRFGLLALLPAVVFFSCQPELENTSAEDFKMGLQGEAQGTTYSISYYDLQKRDFKSAVDSLLRRVDESISTYVPTSLISQFNSSDTCVQLDQIFTNVLLKSWEVYYETGGAFDPTVKPLVDFWGFGSEKFVEVEAIDSAEIFRLQQLAGMDKLQLSLGDSMLDFTEVLRLGDRVGRLWLCKSNPEMKLDFNAIGQGYSVDMIARFLESKGIERYFVEVGGEIRAGYPKPDGALWKFGIDMPQDSAAERKLEAVISLRNRGLATSGNYRKYYIKDGKKYAHTIDPASGFPAEHNLLSATVVAADAATADGFATAFMVMGTDSTLRFLKEHSHAGTQVHLIFDENGTNATFTSGSLSDNLEFLGR